MVDEAKRKAALEQIREHIVRKGHHVYVVVGSVIPRYAYTIGVSESSGAELILAGASFYGHDEVVEIINDIVAQLKAERGREKFEVIDCGSFTLCKAHHSWATEFMLGAFDYYQNRDIPGLQIVPDKAHWTMDVPDISAPWNASTAPVWRWLKEPWTFPVPEDSRAVTNLAGLRGERITEVVRWEEDEWEMFAGAGPDVPKDEMRVVGLGSLVASDKSLEPVVHLGIGEGLWRDPDPNSEWHPWRKRQQRTGTIQ
jgi:hypothetical protein